MSVTEFENGYWYATDVKRFAKEIGIPASNTLRKDELEIAIKNFLNTGRIQIPTQRKLTKSSSKDTDLGLHLDLPVINYTSNKETKTFIVREALKMSPGLKEKSGARYRLNRWREAQLTKKAKITYRDIVKQYVKLIQTREPFKRIASTRYINFLSDFLANEKGATRQSALDAWNTLKRLPIPKEYEAWKKNVSSKNSK